MRFGLWLLLLVAIPAFTAEVSVQDGLNAVRTQFSYATTQVKILGNADWRPFQFPKGCPQLKVSGPAGLVDVKSPDSHLFGSVAVFVELLEKDVYAYDSMLENGKYKYTLSEPCHPPFYKGPFAMIQYDRLWVTVRGQCSDGDLFAYEVGEVLSAFANKSEFLPPEKFLYSPCGMADPRIIHVEEFLSELRKTRTYWGKKFPKARESRKVTRKGYKTTGSQ